MNSIYQQIKDRLSITEVLKHYNVKKSRGKNSYYCPIHENDGKKHKPSLVASDEKGTATCLSQRCFDNDDIFSFIAKIERCTKHEALQKASSLVGIDIASSDKCQFFNQQDQVPNLKKAKPERRINGLQLLGKQHIKWLYERGIKESTAKIFGLQAKDDLIAFPHIANKSISGWKLRSINDKSKTWQVGPVEGDIDISAKLWGFHAYEMRENSITQVIIVEGEPDCLLLAQKLIEADVLDIASVTCTAGANATPEDSDELKQYFPNLRQISVIYDNDEAGKNGSHKLTCSLKKLGIPIQVYSFPENKKKGYDITDFIQEGNSFTDIFHLSTTLITSYYHSRQPVEKLDQAYINTQTIKTGIVGLDLLCDGLQGFVVIGGETGTGKTTFMLNIVRYAIEQQHPVLYVSYELGYVELRVKLAAMLSDYDYSQLCKNRSLFTEGRKSLISNPAMDYLKIIDTTLLSKESDHLEEGIEALKKEFPDSKIPLVVIDYLQGMPIVSTSEYRLSLASSVQKLRDLVQKENIVVLAASATNTQRSSGNALHAGVFRETSEIEYSAYIALILGYSNEQRENGNVKPEEIRFPSLYVVKNRFGPKNTKGIPLEVDWEKQTYIQKGREV